MLKGIDPLLIPDLLHLLASIGHDESIALVDANFTAQSISQGKQLLRLPGIPMHLAMQAVLSVLPLVADEVHPVAFMHVSGKPEAYRSALQREVLTSLVDPLLLSGQSAEAVERYAFYERARKALAIVVTGELQPFANFIVRKVVLGEPLRP